MVAYLFYPAPVMTGLAFDCRSTGLPRMDQGSHGRVCALLEFVLPDDQ